jgi:hypothetical protein
MKQKRIARDQRARTIQRLASVCRKEVRTDLGLRLLTEIRAQAKKLK